MTNVTRAGLEAMGFRPFESQEPIVARFHSLHVYEVRGISLKQTSLPPCSGAVGDRPYEFAFGSSVNEVSCALSCDEFTDDEVAWQRKKKCRPPYLVIHLGPSKEDCFAGTHVKTEGDTLVTYDGFPRAREEMIDWERGVLPHVLTGLASAFWVGNQPTRFVQIERALYGETSDKHAVFDSRMSAHGSAYVATPLTVDEVSERSALAVKVAGSTTPEVARLSRLALEEDDPVKRFLYFFQAMERLVHATFAKIDHRQHVASLITAPPNAPETTRAFFETQCRKSTNIRDRFVWCTICEWKHLTDSDVEHFKELKETRDKLAHGSIASPTAAAVREAERLAARLQRSELESQSSQS